MSELQIGLVVLGVLLILAVLGVNWWQDRRARQHVRTHFGGLTEVSTQADPLAADAARREPGLSADEADADWGDADQGSRADPHADPHASPHGDGAHEADPACEVVLELGFAEPVAGQALRAALRTLHAVGGKPVRLLAKTVDEVTHARLHDAQDYRALQLILLLANRSGPIDAIDWSRFWNQAQQLAERFEATLEGPEQDAVIEQARRLDEFCAALDVQVGLTLHLAQPQAVPAVFAVARDLGWVRLDGRLLCLSDEGLLRFSLAPEEEREEAARFDERTPVARLALLLDVPHSPAHARAFSAMAQLGRELAARLDARLLDDQGKPVPPGSEAGVDAQLAELYARLAQAGMAAGSLRAKRIFS